MSSDSAPKSSTKSDNKRAGNYGPHSSPNFDSQILIFMYGLSDIDNIVNTSLSEIKEKEFRINGEHEAYVSFACNGEIKPI